MEKQAHYQVKGKAVISDIYLAAYLEYCGIKCRMEINNDRVQFCYDDPSANKVIINYYNNQAPADSVIRYVEALKQTKIKMYKFKGDRKT